MSKFKVRDNRGRTFVITRSPPSTLKRLLGKVGGGEVYGSFSRLTRGVWVSEAVDSEMQDFVIRHEIAHYYDRASLYNFPLVSCGTFAVWFILVLMQHPLLGILVILSGWPLMFLQMRFLYGRKERQTRERARQISYELLQTA